MPLVDSHCHLQDKAFDEDREKVIVESLEILDWFVVVGDDLSTSEAAVRLCRPNVYAAVGVHPYHAATVNDETIQGLRELASAPNVVAIGEIGLDYFKYNETPRDVQQEAFKRQIELAAELNLPVVIHNRESTDDLCDILDDMHASLPGGVIHCFAGSTDFVKRALSWGFHISFAGNVTFPKAEELRVAAREVPPDRLLVETDAPYLAPQPVRGRRCEPGHVRHTAEALAQLTGVTLDTLATSTAQNAAQLFRIPR